MTTFHTLARVKAENGDAEPQRRVRAEAEIIGCTDAICVSCTEEEHQFRRLYGNPPGRMEIVAPGVEHAFFAPGDRTRRSPRARPRPAPAGAAVRRPDPAAEERRRGRARRSHALDRPDAVLVIVGGASGVDGDAEVEKLLALVDELGLGDRVRFVPPQPHHLLSSCYRAADVVLVPSRSESFGLVALEAAACGTPVVAAAVGGLLTLGRPRAHRLPRRGPRPGGVRGLHRGAAGERRAWPGRWAVTAAARSRRYTWSLAAARLRRLYADLTVGSLVACS